MAKLSADGNCGDIKDSLRDIYWDTEVALF